MIVPTMFFALAWTYPIACNFVPSYRDAADKTDLDVKELKAEHEDHGDIIEKSSTDRREIA